MKTKMIAALAAAILSLSAAGAIADDSKSYTEGTVSNITSVRTKPGMFDTYMKYLNTTYKQLLEDQKKAGIVLDYGIYRATPRSPHDPDLYLVVVFKNFGALDGLDDRIEPLTKKIYATREAGNKASADRESIREILGSQLIQKLNLK
jgi:hypothetical protein